jgi:chemotaxis protein methyltransferase WspC
MSFQDELTAWLAADYGLDLPVFGAGSVEEVVGARCRALGLPSEAAYPDRWRTDPAERKEFLDRLLVGETWFFREWAAYALLGDWIIRHGPRFTATAPLRLLTLPCATGEEAWSMAAVIREAGLAAPRVIIEAMDISPTALEYAQCGVYPQRKLRSQPLERWAHWLHPTDGTTLTIDDSLRPMVRFIEANAMDSGLLLGRPSYHIIFCRNMLIYMSGEARNQICSTLIHCLQPDGLLFLGHAEQPPPGSGLTRQEGEGAFAWRRFVEAPSAPSRITREKPNPLPVRESRLSGALPTAPLTRPVTPPPVPSAASNAPVTAIGLGVDLEPVRQLADRGRYAEALQRLDTPAANQSLDPSVHGLAGVLLGALNRKSEAIARLRRALYLDPLHAESLTHLALLLEESGDAAGAARLRGRLVGEPRRAGA